MVFQPNFGALNTVHVLLRRDADYGTAGTMLIPGTRLAVSNDKSGVIYLLNLDKLGGFQARSHDSASGCKLG